MRYISAKKGEPEWMLEWRLGAFRRWVRDDASPTGRGCIIPQIDYQNSYYYAAPKNTPLKQSLDEVDPKLLETYKKLGIPLHEQMALAGVAVDAVFDSVVGRHHLQGQAERGGRDLLPDQRSDPRLSRAGEEISGHAWCR